MKKGTKLLLLVCVLVMVFSLNVTAYASETPTATDTSQQYQVTIGNNTVTLNEGEVVEVSMIAENKSSGISTCGSSQTIVGNMGTLKVWGSGHRIYWDIDMNIPCTDFLGTVTSTDLTTGLSSGVSLAEGLSGSCYCASKIGHTYAAHLSGKAYFMGTSIAKTSFNTITWVVAE